MISVICSTYNRPDCLERLIKNLKEQTYQDWELLVMDESPDWYSQDMHGGDPRITTQHCERFNDWGYSVKEIGAARARGDYLCFPADDAQYHPQFFEKLLALNVDFAYSDFTHNGTPCNAAPEVCRIDIGGFIVKKHVFEAVGFPDHGDLADGKFAELVAKDYTHTKVPEILYYKT
jgi:glycosyltransferase involved in cell wall biosynthesis